jgi:aconitate hydratase 2/2-methylisocitrate dehydratase
MLQAYRQHVAERAALGIPPLPLTAQQTAEVIALLKTPAGGRRTSCVDLLTHRVPAGRGRRRQGQGQLTWRPWRSAAK